MALSLETRCPDCGAVDPPYQHVLEHVPCGCIRPFEAFADAGGCPDCGGVTDAAVIGRCYTCPACQSSFDTPTYRLTADGTASRATAATASAFEWGPTLERPERDAAAENRGMDPAPADGRASESRTTAPESSDRVVAGGGGD